MGLLGVEHKIEDFIIDSDGMVRIDENSVEFVHGGSYVDLKNNLDDRDIFFSVDKYVKKYKQGWLGIGEQRIYNEHELEDFTLKPGEIRKIMNTEHNWESVKGEYIRRDIDIKVALVGIGERGEGDYKKDIEIKDPFKNWWKNNSYTIIMIGLGIGIISIVGIMWKYNIIGNLIKKVE